jgi:hypothetical protein
VDFEEFKRKKKEEKERQARIAAESARGTASGKELNWVEGLGPAQIANPKVKGFVLGRYQKQKVDPRNLEKPDGFTAYATRTSAAIKRRVECCNENAPPSVALVICHGCRKLYHPQCLYEADEGVCCPGKAVLLAPPPRLRSEKSIAQQRQAQGIAKPKGLQKY